jgi:hypothetical protein
MSESPNENPTNKEEDILLQEMKRLRSEIKGLRELILAPDEHKQMATSKTNAPWSIKKINPAIFVAILILIGIVLGVIFLATKQH